MFGASQGGVLWLLEVWVLRFRVQDSGLVLGRVFFSGHLGLTSEGIAKGPCESHMNNF